MTSKGPMVTAAIAQCRAEQLACASLLADQPDQSHGLRLAISDWMAEEVWIETRQEGGGTCL